MKVTALIQPMNTQSDLVYPLRVDAWTNRYKGNRFLGETPRKLVGIVTGCDWHIAEKAKRLALRAGCNCFRVTEARTGDFIMSGHNF